MSVNTDIENKMKTGLKSVNRLLSKKEIELINLYKISLKEIKQDLANLYEKMGNTPSLADGRKYNRLSNMAKSVQSQLTLLGNQSKSLITDGIKSSFSETYNISGYALESGLGINLGFTALPQDAMTAKALLDGVVNHKIFGIVDGKRVIIGSENVDPFNLINWKDSAKETISGFNKKVKQAITKGFIKGDSYQQIAKELGSIGGKNASQMMRILRTEGGRASSKGYLRAESEVESAAANLGLGINNKWVATLDSKTRDTHQSLDGTLGDKEGLFYSGGGNAEAPRMFGIASEDINCRCTLVPEVEGMENGKYRKARDSQGKSVLVKNQNYKEWSESKKIRTAV